jgi:hypothetical protein
MSYQENFLFRDFFYGEKGATSVLHENNVDQHTLPSLIAMYGWQRYVLFATKCPRYRKLADIWKWLSARPEAEGLDTPSWAKEEASQEDWHNFCCSVAAFGLENHDSTLWFFLAPRNWRLK